MCSLRPHNGKGRALKRTKTEIKNEKPQFLNINDRYYKQT